MSGDLFSNSNKRKKRLEDAKKSEEKQQEKSEVESENKHNSKEIENSDDTKAKIEKNVPLSDAGLALRILKEASGKKDEKSEPSEKEHKKPIKTAQKKSEAEKPKQPRKRIIELQTGEQIQDKPKEQEQIQKQRKDVIPDEKVFSVLEITNKIKKNLENNFANLSIRGEVSKPSVAPSGHIYFNIKDSQAVLSCVIWKGVAQKIKYKLVDGDDVIVKGGITVFAPNGKYQLTVTEIFPVGKGALYFQYEMLKRKLGEEGLFDSSRKKKLPMLPKCVGVVSAETGAAISDIIRVIHERFPFVEIILSPTLVQGEKAAEKIAEALKLLDNSGFADVLIIGRGGGSFEDLVAFNEEIVVRAVAECKTPVIAAIGHERDFTLAELAADVRAATPSQAGEFAVPVYADKIAEIKTLNRRLHNAWLRQIEAKKRAYVNLVKLLNMQNPVKQLHLKEQRIDDLSIRLNYAIANRIKNAKQFLSNLSQHLRNQEPSKLLAFEKQKLEDLIKNLKSKFSDYFADKKQKLTTLSEKLKILSPYNILERGYSLTADAQGNIIKNSDSVKDGEIIVTTLAQGELNSIVKKEFTSKKPNKD